MRRKSKYVFADPAPGTTRLKRVFAWTPQYIDGDVVIWEYYEILQAFLIFEYKIQIDTEIKSVKVSEWKDISKRIIQ